MRVIILAAGQGTRLRPLTDDCPKCMVKVNGVSLIDRQIAIMRTCGIKDEEIYIVAGYREDLLCQKFLGTAIHIISNLDYEVTNMVCSLMCAEEVMKSVEDIVISYGDIFYEKEIFKKILEAQNEISVVVDDGWHSYWSERCENPLDDAESLVFDESDSIMEIGQKTSSLEKVMAQYIGLIKFSGKGIQKAIQLAHLAEQKSMNGQTLWKTERPYSKMYMTDLLQGLIEEGNVIKAVHIDRGWYEIDDYEDLKVVEKLLKEKKA